MFILHIYLALRENPPTKDYIIIFGGEITAKLGVKFSFKKHLFAQCVGKWNFTRKEGWWLFFSLCRGGVSTNGAWFISIFTIMTILYSTPGRTCNFSFEGLILWTLRCSIWRRISIARQRTMFLPSNHLHEFYTPTLPSPQKIPGLFP